MKGNLEIEKNDNKPKKKEMLSPGQLAWKRLRRNKLALAGLGILIFLIFACYILPLFMDLDPLNTNILNAEQPPSKEFWLGTDEAGMDVFARLLYAGRISLLVGVFSVVISTLIGVVLGMIAGYKRGIAEVIIMRIVDIMMCIPQLPLLLMLSAIMSDFKVHPKYRIFILMLIIGLTSWMGLSRLVRAQILSFREQEFMVATEALGLSTNKKLFRHLLPNLMGILIVRATLGLGGAILTESALSFLGLGVCPPTPSWGQMVKAVNDSYVMTNQPWLWIPPGLCIFAAVMSINLFGDGLRDALDPKMKR